MKKPIRITHFLFLLILVCSASCKDDHTGENCIDNNPGFNPEPVPEMGSLSLTFYNNSKITTRQQDGITYAEITSGDMTVFQYYYTVDPEPMAIDDEYEHVILFEVSVGTDEFLLSGNDLDRANAMFGNFCFCSAVGYFPITSGCIKGQKMNKGEWHIDINILAEIENQHYFSKMLSERFLKR